MQSLIVSQISNLDTMVWRMGQGGDVAVGTIEKCDFRNWCCVTFANLFISLPLLDVLSERLGR